MVAGALAIEPLATAAELGAVLGLAKRHFWTRWTTCSPSRLFVSLRSGRSSSSLTISSVKSRVACSMPVAQFASTGFSPNYCSALTSPKRRHASPRTCSRQATFCGPVAMVRVAGRAFEKRSFLDCIAACDKAIIALQRLERSPEGDDDSRNLIKRTAASKRAALCGGRNKGRS